MKLQFIFISSCIVFKEGSVQQAQASDSDFPLHSFILAEKSSPVFKHPSNFVLFGCGILVGSQALKMFSLQALKNCEILTIDNGGLSYVNIKHWMTLSCINPIPLEWVPSWHPRRFPFIRAWFLLKI